MAVLETPMDNLITDSYLALTEVDAAFSHGWRYGAPVMAGPVTVGDLWQMIPTNPEVFTAELTGEQILSLIERSFESVYSPDPLRQKGGYPVRVSGLNAVVRINNPAGARVQELQIRGKPYIPDRIYRVAGAGEQDLAHAEKRQGTGVTAVEAIERYLRQHPSVDSSATHTKFIAI